MAYGHGIEIQENPTAVAPSAVTEGGVQIVIGTAPVHLAEDPFAVTNVPLLFNTFADAQKKLGYSEAFSKYTLSEAMFASLQMSGVSPIVFINVLDPNTHKLAVTDQSITLTKGIGKINDEGVLLSKVVVKSTDGTKTFVRNTDYTLSFGADGKPIITVLGAGIGSAANVKVTYDKIDSSKVTKTNIIGGYDSTTGKYTGTELIQKVYPMLSVMPGSVLAPGWSHYPEVAAVLVAKARNINGCFNADVVLDVDSSLATKYENVPAWKNDNGYTSERSVVLWPKVKVGTKVLWYSSVFAALNNVLDSGTEGVPSRSPSNKSLSISGTVLADGTTEVYLDPPQANYLNENGIVTALNWGGWKAWGNNTAGYPNTTDPKDRYINLRRIMNWWGNSFVTAFFNRVDDLTDTRLIQDIVDSENIRGNGYAARGYIAGASIEFREDLNPQSDIINGKITFITKIGGYTPAEHIVNILEFDPTFMVGALFGGE
ncbi:phage tail sheath family protein [Niallia taxi]|uniref:phage tail sheath family protein n=1 Tax=Niallia taxi TaxID=2499688 RepID=UPI00398229A0